MNTFQSIRDRFRTLTGERHQRRLPRRSAKPAVASRIVHVESGVRLTVQAGLSDELWIWLLDAGWRLDLYRPDRRQYRDISRPQVARLFDCDPANRKILLDQAIWDAKHRPTAQSQSRGKESTQAT
jgi:hypothetical protein